jgi:ABC-2 type transport system ATP-binding protein
MYDGNLNQLRKQYGKEETVTADIVGDFQDLKRLKDLGVSEVTCENNKITVRYDSEKVNSSAVVSRLIDEYETRDINIERTQIEDVIRNMYKFQERVRQ